MLHIKPGVRVSGLRPEALLAVVAAQPCSTSSATTA